MARNIGRKRALEMALTGDVDRRRARPPTGASSTRSCPPTSSTPRRSTSSRRATRGSALSKGLGKHGFYAQVDLDQPKAYAYAVEVMAAAAITDDAQEGIRAFLEKRKPEFKR